MNTTANWPACSGAPQIRPRWNALPGRPAGRPQNGKEYSVSGRLLTHYPNLQQARRPFDILTGRLSERLGSGTYADSEQTRYVIRSGTGKIDIGIEKIGIAPENEGMYEISPSCSGRSLQSLGGRHSPQLQRKEAPSRPGTVRSRHAPDRNRACPHRLGILQRKGYFCESK